MKRILLFGTMLLSVCGLRAGIFNTNLVVNGNAEVGPGSIDGYTVEPVPGWVTTNGFTVAVYGTPSDIPATCPGPIDRGTNLFTGGPDTTGSSGYQLIDLSSAAPQIDAGLVLASVSGYLGGWQAQDDRATLIADFTDGVHTNVLRSLTVGPVFAVERTNATALLYREGLAPIPAGARQVKLSLLMTFTSGGYTDGYADNIALVLVTNRPALAVQNKNNFVVSWPTNFATGYLLQQNTNLLSTNWTTTTNAVLSGNGTNQVTFSLPVGNKFFRLSHP